MQLMTHIDVLVLVYLFSNDFIKLNVYVLILYLALVKDFLTNYFTIPQNY